MSIKPLNAQESKTAMNVALGKEKADLAIIDANVLNVYTGEFLDKHSVSVKGRHIVYVGDNAGHTVGPETIVIDAKGKTLIPGLIEGHTHLAWLFNISEFLRYAMKGGTTTIITESMEAFAVMGYEGVLEFLASLENQPVKILSTAPAMISVSHAAFGVPREIIRKLMSRKDIVGIGESYWQAVFQEPDKILPCFEEALLAGKTLEGHSAGAKGNKLTGYAALGISSCHEPITAREVIERLRLGIYVMVREGSIRRDLETISEIKDSGISLRRLALATDGVQPEDLMEKGYMEFVVQKAIDSGFDPIAAVQMATLNVAEHFHLDAHIGGIAPGKYADMLIIPDPRKIEAEYVISNGHIICHEGNLLVSPRQHVFSEQSRNTVNLPVKFRASDFCICPEITASSLEVRVIEMKTDLVTKETKHSLPVTEGEIRSDMTRDILKIAAIDRRIHPGKIFTGLIKGFGMKAGAIASSAAWDTSDIIVVGADDSDMAAAVNRIYDLQGGAVLCVNGSIIEEIPMPVMGIISDLPMETLVQKIKSIRKTLSELGCLFPDPLLTLVALTGAAIPYLRICEEGLVNLKDGKTLGLFFD